MVDSIQYTRWSHKCPCGKQVIWRKVYCAACIKEYPPRGDFLLRTEQRRLNRRKLLGVGHLNGPFLLLSRSGSTQEMMCVACGKIMVVTNTDNGNLKHQCYWYGIGYAGQYRKIHCLMCRTPKVRVHFAQLPRGERKIRSRICVTCLRKNKIMLSA